MLTVKVSESHHLCLFADTVTTIATEYLLTNPPMERDFEKTKKTKQNKTKQNYLWKFLIHVPGQ